MPELPEITIYKRYVEQTSLNQKIKKVQVHHSGGLRADQTDFETALLGKHFTQTRRLGKYLFIQTSGSQFLVMHFGMTGEPIFYKNQEPPKYSRVVFCFEEGGNLAFSCRRKLGKIFLSTGVEDFSREHDLGPDALELSLEKFLERIEGKTGSVKGVLTDQSVLSGIGNVYSDEMLYQCQIHPKTRTHLLSKKQKEQLFQKMREVLEKAIEVEGVRKDFPKNYLISHRKEGESCPNCPGKINKIKVSGRSTYFCPSCQKESSRP